MKALTLGWLLLLLLGMGLSAQAQPPIPRALLRVHASYLLAGHGLHLVDSDLFISIDRSVTAVVSLANNTNPLPPGWSRQSKSAFGSPEDFATLVAVLADNRIAQQTGNCSVQVTLISVSGTFEVTWYSRGTGKNVLAVNVNANGSSPPCQPEIARILSGIKVYSDSAGVSAIGPGCASSRVADWGSSRTSSVPGLPRRRDAKAG